MTETAQTEVPEPPPMQRSASRVAAWVGLVIVTGVIGNAAWSLLSGPIFHGLLKIATLGSGLLRDQLYRDAATNPMDQMSPMMPMIGSAVFLGFGMYVSFSRERRSRGGARFDKVLMISGLVMGSTLVSAAILGEAEVQIWSAFHSNLERCMPHLERSVELELRSRFASMETRADYAAIQSRFEDVTQGKCRLVPAP